MRTFYDAATDAAHQNGAGASEREAVIVQASTITPERIEWIWAGRLAVGVLTNCVGLPDQGKTLLFSDITGRITRGAPMPPGRRELCDAAAAGRVLILTAEDALGYTMVPRLMRAGADLTRVDFVQMVKDADGSTSLVTLETDLDVLAAAMKAKAYRLIVIDGIAGYLGTAKTHVDADVRRVLTPFVALLEQTRVAGFSVMHPPKAIANLAYFAGGSVAFTSVPRVTLGVAPDPNDDSPSPRRLLVKIKGNLYGRVPTLAYRIVADGPADVPWLEWVEDPVEDVNVADVFDPPRESAEDRSTISACVEWLRSYLTDEDKPAKEAEDAAKDAGFKPRTIERAKAKAGVDSVRRAVRGPWYWTLPTKGGGSVR